VRLNKLFAASGTEHCEDELAEWCRHAREAVLEAACALQCDSAVLPGTQMGVSSPPEPFASQQQKRSKLDGQEEEADDNRPRRPLITVTGRELNGHLKREEAKAVAEQRLLLRPYKEMPLTGAARACCLRIVHLAVLAASTSRTNMATTQMLLQSMSTTVDCAHATQNSS
jgi:hypothetical protein